MIFKNFDLISTPITLHYKGDSKHSSIFSGILTIISIIIRISFAIYYTIGFVNKSNPTIYFYTRYVGNAGNFPLNSSSLFHFIRLGNTYDNQNEEIDFQSVSIYGFDFSIDLYMSDNNISNFNHWIYGPCNNDDAKNIKHLETVINQRFPEKGACIRQYYDKEKGKYYNTNEEDFKWPALLKGCVNEDAKNYGFIVEKCRNNGNPNKICKKEEEIDAYLEHSFLILYFMDQYADILNYKTPYIKYLYKLTNAFFSDYFTINHLNFNPAIVTSHNGIFFDNKINEVSYQFIQNEKATLKNNNTNIIASCYFWMQNTMQIHERNYERFQDFLSDIGGFSSIVNFFIYAINLFWSNYIILLDTEELILNTDKTTFSKTKDKFKPNLLKNINNVMNPPKLKIKKMINNNCNDSVSKQQSSLFQILIKDKVDLYKNKNNYIDSKSESCKNNEFKKSDMLYLSDILKNKNKYKYKNKINESSQQNVNINADKNNSHYIKSNSNNNSNSNKDNYKRIDSKNITFKGTLNELETEILEDKLKNLAKQNFSWINYILHFFYCKSKNSKLLFYENFRTHLISEENIIQNHLNVYKLLKIASL